LQSQLTSLQQALDKSVATISKRDEELKALNSRVSSLETLSVASEGNSSVLNEKIMSQEESLKAKEKLIVALEGNVAQRELLVKEWEAKYNEMVEKNAQMKQQNATLQNSI
jgi:hypothetical protein